MVVKNGFKHDDGLGFMGPYAGDHVRQISENVFDQHTADLFVGAALHRYQTAKRRSE